MATINGTKHADLIDDTHTAPGQPFATGGDDTIFGNNGADEIHGGGGDDTIDGGKAIDNLFGDAGNDTFVWFDQYGLGDIINGGADTDTIMTTGSDNIMLAGFNATASSIEIWDGNGHGVIGIASAGIYDFSGLTAKTGLSFIDGGGGADKITASNFGDDMRGGGKDDELHGGAGADIFSGGEGNDKFFIKTGGGADTVTDYKAGHDKFDLTVAGVTGFSDLHLTQVDPTTVLIDFDGTPGGDSVTVLKTTIAVLTAHQGDFIFH